MFFTTLRFKASDLFASMFAAKPKDIRQANNISDFLNISPPYLVLLFSCFLIASNLSICSPKFL